MVARKEKNYGKYVKSMVYGGLDGLITTFAVVSGVVGGSLSINVIIVLGFSNLLADGFSMAVGDYLSSKSEKEYNENQLEKANRTDLADNFKSAGISNDDSYSISQILSKYDKDVVSTVFENEEEETPIKNATVTFFSFFVFGLVPLLTYVFAQYIPFFQENAFTIASILTGITLFVLGTAKSSVTQSNWLKSGLEMLAVGGGWQP